MSEHDCDFVNAVLNNFPAVVVGVTVPNYQDFKNPENPV